MTVAACVSIATLVVITLMRLVYPYELEWIEGGVVDHIDRIREGQPYYGPPSIHGTAFIYPPLYFYTAAAVSFLTGPGFVPLRLVSWTSCMLGIALIFRIVSRESGGRAGGVVAAGTYAACFEFCGSWCDIGRVDSLLLLLLLTSVYILRFRTSVAGAVACGTVLTLAFFTKQTAIGLLVPCLVVALFRGWRHLAALASVAAVGMGGGLLLLNWLFDGWFWWYAFHLVYHHRRMRHLLHQFWTEAVLPVMGIAILLAAIYVIGRALSRDLSGASFWALTGGGLVVLAWISTAKVGGFSNLGMPAAASLAIFVGLAFEQAFQLARDRSTAPAALVALLVAAGSGVQLCLLAYDPRAQVPTAADRAAGDRVVAKIRSLPGDVFTPFHGHLTTAAGKKRWVHVMAVDDCIRGDRGEATQRLQAELHEALSGKKFGAVVLGGPMRDVEQWLARDLLPSYGPTDRFFEDDASFWPRTGRHIRPEAIWQPKARAAAP